MISSDELHSENPIFKRFINDGIENINNLSKADVMSVMKMFKQIIEGIRMNRYIIRLKQILKFSINPFKAMLYLKISHYTMIPPSDLRNSYRLAKKARKIEGDIIECGTYNGGCIAMMGFVSKKRIWLFDSFKGFPTPTIEDGEKARKFVLDKDKMKRVTGSVEKTKEIISKLNCNAVIRKGWFKDTIPKASMEIDKIAVLRLDGDLYESTKVCLEYLYSKVVEGGYVIIDDYGACAWKGCRKATDEFLSDKNVDLIKVGDSVVYFKKMKQDMVDDA